MPKSLLLLAALVALGGCAQSTGPSAQAVPAPAAAVEAVVAAAAEPEAGLSIAVEQRTLENGLTVVVAPDPAVPTVTVAVYYGIGWRIEPKGETGFAHLFEHLMFQGSENVPKGQFDKLVMGNGGVLNGSTRWDYTNYYQVVPTHAAELVVWAEADRMRSLALTPENLQNQKDVVKNEVKVNVLNQPYGGFIWLDVPQVAFENFYNGHNFYGDLADLDAATMEQAAAFHGTFYTPANAVLVIAGDVTAEQAFGWAKTYFGGIEGGEDPPLPDLTEPPQTKEKIETRVDPLAPRPGLAFAYKVPERGTPEWWAMGYIESLLAGGADSLLETRLVRERGYTDGVAGGINPFLGNMFSYDGPMLMTFGLIHDAGVNRKAVMADVDEIVHGLQTELVSEDELERIRTELRSGLYDVAGSSNRFGLVDLLASFALFDGDASKINEIEAGMESVTPELIRETARKYLRSDQRTVLYLDTANPGDAS